VNKLRMLLWSYFYRVQCEASYWIAKHAPHIRNPVKPRIPDEVCPACGEPIIKIVAVDTGDGWSLMCECPNDCGMAEVYLVAWWPYLFGAFCNAKQLRAAGIEVV